LWTQPSRGRETRHLQSLLPLLRGYLCCCARWIACLLRPHNAVVVCVSMIALMTPQRLE
jgi:hypothetical protein